MSDSELTSADILALGPVMPVIVIDDVSAAVAVADALAAGGITGIEITLRTPAALDAIRVIAQERPNMVVGAGTILGAADAAAAADAGARFAVSPGSTDAIIAGCHDAGLPLLPGAATVSEMLHLNGCGFDIMKFFPASAAGGIDFLRALTSPLPHLRFCPTGGISQTNVTDWLALANVGCVGGSWIAPQDLIAAGDFGEITHRARAASALR